LNRFHHAEKYGIVVMKNKLNYMCSYLIRNEDILIDFPKWRYSYW